MMKMKLELNEKIQKIVDSYKTNMELQRKAIKEIIKPYRNPANAGKFTTKGLKEIIKVEMDELFANWKKYDIELNQKIKAYLNR